jgi:hypothetical protein
VGDFIDFINYVNSCKSYKKTQARYSWLFHV